MSVQWTVRLYPSFKKNKDLRYLLIASFFFLFFSFSPLLGDGKLELTEVRMGPSLTISRPLPVVSFGSRRRLGAWVNPQVWLASNSEPGCVLNVPHFSILCNTPPGIGRDNYFFLTVNGQTMQVEAATTPGGVGTGSPKQGATSYKLPNVERLTPKSGIIRTNGGDVVRVEGLDYGIQNTDVSVEAWLIRPGTNVATFKGGAGSGLVVLPVNALRPTKDTIEFPVPAGFGRFNVYIRVFDTVTGQSEISANFVPLVYDSPIIATTTILTGSTSTNQVSISGSNFCGEHQTSAAGCGELFLCKGKTSASPNGCGSCFSGEVPVLPTDPPQTIDNPTNSALGTTSLWSHTFARVSTTSSDGCVYVRVGTNPLNYQYSNAVSFTSSNPLILKGEDLPNSDTNFISRIAPYPTSALDANSIPILFKVLVSNLNDPTKANTKIKIGPFGCSQDVGSAEIKSIVATATVGNHIITVLLPEGTGTDVQVKVCLYALASAPALIHYSPPVVTSVRHLPYLSDGTNELQLIGQNGGLPTGGSSYEGFTPTQMDGAIAVAEATVVAAQKQFTAAQTAKVTAQTESDTASNAVTDCENYVPPLSACTSTTDANTGVTTVTAKAPCNADSKCVWEDDANGTPPFPFCSPVDDGSQDCTPLETDAAAKLTVLNDAGTALIVKDRTYQAALLTKKGLVEAKSTPYTFQYLELLGANFASSTMNALDPFPFSIQFEHVDPLIKDPVSSGGLGKSFSLLKKAYGGTVSTCVAGSAVACCPVWTHTRIVCKIPPGSGKGWLFAIAVGNQNIRWPAIPSTMPYAVPTVEKVLPVTGSKPTEGFVLTLTGKNFGTGTAPTVTIASADSTSDVGLGGAVCTVLTATNDEITCQAPPGQGKDLKMYVSNGPGLVASNTSKLKDVGHSYARTSNVIPFSYDAPTITGMDVTSGPTSGRSHTTGDTPGVPVVITLTGTNFGTSENANIQVNVYPSASEQRVLPFVSQGKQIISHDHTSIAFQLPPGYGAGYVFTVLTVLTVLFLLCPLVIVNQIFLTFLTFSKHFQSGVA